MEPKNKEEPRTTKFSEHCFLTLLNIQTGSVRVNMVTKAYVGEAVERIARTGNKDLHWIVDIDTGDSSDSRHYGTINEPSFMVTRAYVGEAVERIARTGNKDLHWIVEIDTDDSSDSRHYGTINEPSFMVMVKGILDNSPLEPDESLATVIQKFGLVGPEWEKFY